MSFSNVPADNPFEPGVTFSASYDTEVDLSDLVNIGIASFSSGWPESNPSLGLSFTTDANNNLVANIEGSGGGGRPSSGLVYPRLT